MNKEIIPVSKKKHKNYFFHSVYDYSSDFSSYKKLFSCPIFYDEIKHVASCYPIAFVKNENGFFYTASIFSLLRDNNLYINKKNQWTGSYIPAYFRIQPFFLAKSENIKDNILCFLSDSPSIKSTSTPKYFPFMDEKGENSKELNKIIKILLAIDRNKEKTINALKDLDNLGLIKEFKLIIKTDDTKAKQKIKGLYIIDSEKLKSLSADNLYKLNSNGGLEIAYSQLVSLTTLDSIVKMHKESGNLLRDSKSLRDFTIEKQEKEKKKEQDQLVENLFDLD